MVYKRLMVKKRNLFETPIVVLDRLCKQYNESIEVRRPHPDIMIVRFSDDNKLSMV